MELKRHRVAIGRGEGLVARFGDALMYISDASRARGLLRVLESTVRAPTAALIDGLSPLVHAPESGAVPSFGALVPSGGALQIILHGDVIADIESGGTRRKVGCGGRPMQVDSLAPPFDAIAIFTGATAFTPYLETDLVSGVVPGSGFVLVPRIAPVAARQPAPPTSQARTPSGVLAADDGAVYPLDRPYVIGRNPLIDPAVHDGAASPISVPDDPQVSRVHAYVTISGTTVLVRDAKTAGGTYIAAPGDREWTQVTDRPAELKPGCYLRIGQRILTYQLVNQ